MSENRVMCPTCGYDVELDETGIGLCERDGQFVKKVDDGDGVIASSTDVIKSAESQYNARNKK